MTYESALYHTTFFTDVEQGCMGARLLATSEGKEAVAATLTFWDAAGQFYIEAFIEIPLVVLERFIAEVKGTIKI
jgi:hypothetical protein